MNLRVAGGLAMGMLSLLIAACAGDRPANLGAQHGLFAPCPASPNCVSSQAADDRHRIAPLSFSGDPDRAIARLKQILQSRGDAALIEEKQDYLRVELRTRLFVDDAEFLLDRPAKVIQLRSASRLGYSDLGKNRSRIEEIRTVFNHQESVP